MSMSDRAKFSSYGVSETEDDNNFMVGIGSTSKVKK